MVHDADQVTGVVAGMVVGYTAAAIALTVGFSLLGPVAWAVVGLGLAGGGALGYHVGGKLGASLEALR